MLFLHLALRSAAVKQGFRRRSFSSWVKTTTTKPTTLIGWTYALFMGNIVFGEAVRSSCCDRVRKIEPEK